MNKYLEKAGSLSSMTSAVGGGVKNFGKDFAKGWRRSSTTSKVGLGMSAAGLSLGAANYGNSLENKKDNKSRSRLEAQSLEELKGISEALKKRPKITVNVKAPVATQEKVAGLVQAGREAAHFAKKNPLTSIGAAIGATDGALSTTKQKGESRIRTEIRRVRNTIGGGAAGSLVGTVATNVYNRYLKG